CGAAGRSSLTFSALPDVACKRSEYKSDGTNVNVVLFRDDEWTYRGIDGTLAKTTVTFDAKTGEILDADIEINAAFNNLTVRDATISYDLQSIMTHEIGHMIGFAHSPDPTATMFSSYDPGTIGIRTLSRDDVAALCDVYPPGRVAVCDPTPRGGLGDTCAAAEEDKKGCALSSRGLPAATSAGGGAWLVAGSLFVFAGARRARRARVSTFFRKTRGEKR
ncbi:MAG: matrixin family metalloprotease, partial [Polyangiales bacterium]